VLRYTHELNGLSLSVYHHIMCIQISRNGVDFLFISKFLTFSWCILYYYIYLGFFIFCCNGGWWVQ